MNRRRYIENLDLQSLSAIERCMDLVSGLGKLVEGMRVRAKHELMAASEFIKWLKYGQFSLFIPWLYRSLGMKTNKINRGVAYYYPRSFGRRLPLCGTRRQVRLGIHEEWIRQISLSPPFPRFARKGKTATQRFLVGRVYREARCETGKKVVIRGLGRDVGVLKEAARI